jgi:MFS family permease
MGVPTTDEKKDKTDLQSPDVNFNAHASPALKDDEVFEDGALRPGGTPSLYDWENLGLLIHIGAIGVVYGVNSGVVYAVLNNYLYMSAMLVTTAEALVRTPRSCRMFFAVFSDCYPICGYRRRPYLMLGWALTFVACFLMAVLPLGEPFYGDPSLVDMDTAEMTEEQLALINVDAPDRGIQLMVLLMVANLGTVIAYGASDGLMVELAQREAEHVRGSVQSHMSVVRNLCGMLGAFLTGLGLNSPDYGGSFSWSIGFNGVMGVCAAFAFAAVPGCWFFITEQKALRLPMRAFYKDLFQLLQHRVFFQVIAFRFFRQIFSRFGVTAESAIQSTYAQVEPLNEGLASVFSQGVAAFAVYAVRKWGLHWSWQVLVVASQFGVIFLDAAAVFITIWDVFRAQWFWLGMPLLEEFTAGIGDFVAALFVVEIADLGREATIMSLMATVVQLGSPFAKVMTKTAGGYFDIERKFVANDDRHVHLQLSYAYLVAYAFNLLSVVFVVWLPRQKAEARALKRSGGQSFWMGVLTVSYMVFAFCWLIMTNVLSLFDSTHRQRTHPC